MSVLLPLLLLIAGFIILIKGADWFVDGAAGMAERFGISQLVIGLTVVAMGTSAPEAAVSITSAIKGNAGITIGNIVGSNIMNVLVILGVTALLARVPVKQVTMRREIPFTIAVTVLLGLFGYFAGKITFPMGIVFWILFIMYLAYLFIMTKKGIYHQEEAEKDPADDSGEKDLVKRNLGTMIIFTFIGCAGIILGSDLTVDSATELARIFHMSDRFIGLTIVAFGTSLPELVTSAAAALKNEVDIAVGNIVGSNIFNILFVIGTTALITPVDFDRSFVLDTAAAVAAMIILLLSLLRNRSLTRLNGIIMLACYAAYFVFFLM